MVFSSRDLDDIVIFEGLYHSGLMDDIVLFTRRKTTLAVLVEAPCPNLTFCSDGKGVTPTC